MKYISLNNKSLTIFTARGELSELSGSSRFRVFENEIVSKEKPRNGKIENVTATKEYLNSLMSDDMAVPAIERLCYLYESLYSQMRAQKFTSEIKLTQLERYEIILRQLRAGGYEFPLKYALVCENIREQNSRYTRAKRQPQTEKVLNKSKVRGKMFALFNLKCSRKFIAFYTLSFPEQTPDTVAIECLNAWLTACRKRFNLSNYVWVAERQKNGTLHFHMLTNNRMPIVNVNKAMAKIIDTKVQQGLTNWGFSSVEKYNGVDVDSIYNSKRHKKTGKYINPVEMRGWLMAYVTKYVSKNNEKFKTLCWFCSRSVSMLFTSVICLFSERYSIVSKLPTLSRMYIKFVGQFNETYVFKFIPDNSIFWKLLHCNDLIFQDYEPKPFLMEFGKAISRNRK